MTDADSSHAVRHLSGREALEVGAMCGGLFVLFAGLYLIAGFELTVISMLAVILLGVYTP